MKGEREATDMALLVLSGECPLGGPTWPRSREARQGWVSGRPGEAQSAGAEVGTELSRCAGAVRTADSGTRGRSAVHAAFAIRAPGRSRLEPSPGVWPSAC